MHHRFFALFIFAALPGCATFYQPHRAMRLEEGLVIVLPGIEGESFLSDSVAHAIEDSGFAGAVEVFDWTSGRPLRSLDHLTNAAQSEKQAERLAQKIATYKQAFPRRPIHLFGHSGGGAIIVLALEKLPGDGWVDQVVLLSPALSPRHDLSQSLPKCQQMWNFRSPFDIQLTAGTTLVGTVDRDFTPAAGAYGFVDDSPDDNLTQVSYRPSMLRHGNWGGHMGSSSYRFVRSHVIPTVFGTTPTGAATGSNSP